MFTRPCTVVLNGAIINILDSPSVILFDDDEVTLGILGAKNPEKLQDAEQVALKIIELFLENTTENLESLYWITVDNEDDAYELFVKIGETRRLLKKEGFNDEQQTALTIIKDWQTGRLLLN